MLNREYALQAFVGLLICLSNGAIPSAEADSRTYSDPGHRLLGVYGGPAGAEFDYTHRKLMVTDPFPNKAAWWAKVKSAAASDGAGHHDIYLVYCGERGDAEAALKRLDAWLQPEPGISTYPELIPAISLGEENVSRHRDTLDRLARHVRETYGIPVFQWYSDPLPPDPSLTADGWIWDSYAMKRTAFRKHVMKFFVLRKPLACVVWATDPHWPGWNQYLDTTALMDSMWHQFDICREFNVSCVAFAVAGPGGSVGHWRSCATKDMVHLRAMLAVQRKGMNQLPAESVPLVSADYSARDRSVAIGGPPDAPGVYEESFAGFGWIHDADICGFTHLKQSSQPEEPAGCLDVVTAAGEPVTASLTYRFESFFPFERAQVSLKASAPVDSHGENRLLASPNGREWQNLLTQQAVGEIEQIACELPEWIRGRRDFLLRVDLANCGTRAGMSGNRLDQLRVEATWQPPPDGASASLVKDLYGALHYDDDFSTERWRHLGSLTVSHRDCGGYRSGCFWVGGTKAHVATTHLIQRFVSPHPLKDLVVTADGWADGPNLGGQLVLQVARSGAEPEWTACSSHKHKGPLRLKVPSVELNDLRSFDVHILLHGRSGVDLDKKVCARVSALHIEAK